MESPLRKARISREMTLDDLRDAVKRNNQEVTTGYLSIVERGLSWPSRGLVDVLVDIFDGSITRLDILYPFGEGLEGGENAES